MQITQRLRHIAALLAFVGAAPALAGEFGREDHETLHAGVSAILQEESVTGAALGVVFGGELVFAEGYGVVELGGARAITPRHVFHWASVSKPLVAIAVMQLVEDGRIDLDAHPRDYLPYFSMADDRFEQMTVRQLLAHTAGMPDVEDYEWDNPQTDDRALERWARAQSGAQLLFEPGTRRKYSNIGYEVLGALVAHVSGVTFEQYMAENLFTPLGMANSSFLLSDIDPDLRVSGHVGEETRRVAPDYPYNRRHAPSSTLNSNIEDMALLARALVADARLGDAQLMSEEALAEMWTPDEIASEEGGAQRALGWGIRPIGGQTFYGHAGGDDGFRSYFAVFPDVDIAILLVSNDETISASESEAGSEMQRIMRLAINSALEAYDR